jgi:hypothetical protein
MRLTRNTGRGVAGLLAVAAIVVAMACGGGKSSDSAVSVGTAGAGGPTGNGDLDHLIRSAQDGNFIELASLVGYQTVKCVKGSGGDAPTCGATESEGTSVEALPWSGCERGWIRPVQVTDSFRAALPSGQVQLFAAYEANDTSNSYAGGFLSPQVIVLSTGKRSGVALHVKGGRMMWIEGACSDVNDLVLAWRVKSFIIPPASSGATQAAGTPAASVIPPTATPTTKPR